jgi:hypothetical protein
MAGAQFQRSSFDVVQKPLHAAEALVDRGESAVAGQLLVAPAVEHQLEGSSQLRV